MQTGREQSVEAFVLKAMDYRDNDRIVSYYTAEAGRLDAICMGAKKQGAKLAGAAQPLHRCQVLLVQGKGKLLRVSQYQSLAGYEGLRCDLLAMSALLLLSEVVHRQAEGLAEHSEAVFQELLASADCLNAASLEVQTDNEPRVILCLLGGLLRLLGWLGYLPQLEARSCLSDRPLPPEATVLPFSVAHGGVLLADEITELERQSQSGLLRVSRRTLDCLHQLNSGLERYPDLPAAYWLGQPEAEALASTPAEYLRKAVRFVCYLLKHHLQCALHGETLLNSAWGVATPAPTRA